MVQTENRSPLVEGVTCAMFAIALPPVLIRIWTRISLTKSFGADDWLMVFAMISFTFNSVISYEAAVHGTGRHHTDLSVDSMTIAFQWWYFAYLTYWTSMILAKSSIACFLLRLTPDRNHRIVIYLAWGLTVLGSIAFFFIAMFQCNPISYFWTRGHGAAVGTCIPNGIIIYVTFTYSAFSIITDFTFTILPIWMVWHLQMGSKTKLVLIPILGMAAVASCAVVARLPFVENFRGDDFLWTTADIAIWSQVEIGLAIAAGSLATLRPFFRRLTHRFGLTGLSTSPSAAPEGLPDNVEIASDEQGHRRMGSKGKVKSPMSRMMAQYSVFSLQSNPTRANDRTIRMEKRVFPQNHTRSSDRVQATGNNTAQTASRERLMEHECIGLKDTISVCDSCHSKASINGVQTRPVDE